MTPQSLQNHTSNLQTIPTCIPSCTTGPLAPRHAPHESGMLIPSPAETAPLVSQNTSGLVSLKSAASASRNPRPHKSKASSLLTITPHNRNGSFLRRYIFLSQQSCSPPPAYPASTPPPPDMLPPLVSLRQWRRGRRFSFSFCGHGVYRVFMVNGLYSACKGAFDTGVQHPRLQYTVYIIYNARSAASLMHRYSTRTVRQHACLQYLSLGPILSRTASHRRSKPATKSMSTYSVWLHTPDNVIYPQFNCLTLVWYNLLIVYLSAHRPLSFSLVAVFL